MDEDSLDPEKVLSHVYKNADSITKSILRSLEAQIKERTLSTHEGAAITAVTIVNLAGSLIAMLERDFGLPAYESIKAISEVYVTIKDQEPKEF
jgi:hypothetical protein